MKKHGSVLSLVVCVLGLYGSFLSWSVLQERINTKPYGLDGTNEPDYFKAPLIINIVQALFAGIVGFIYTLISARVNPFSVFTKNDSTIARSYMKSFLLISITSSLSSPLGYQSLKHVDYLAYLLAKSCKLIPVMLIHLTFYRTKFPLYKYIVASSVTFGVAVFTLSHSSKPGKSKSTKSINDGQTLLGMVQLLGSMLLDGLTNSTQDQMFKLKSNDKNKQIVKITGAKLMCILNTFVFVLTLGYALIFAFDSEVMYTVNFIHKHPHVLINILEFAVFGAVGQVFVFIILEKFDSLILITATVTRKMISMILSVVLFGHYLNTIQWCGVGLVFGGIGYEAIVKLMSKKEEKQVDEKKNQ
ncbi:UDP-galactose transporter [Scheffersomyces xylosifermentans]|uniref:UDP-galactose transporter n=1 Tax=Scheffersomyces xylosifermentans TaxID=1304137 RepID=UPI00315D32B0